MVPLMFADKLNAPILAERLDSPVLFKKGEAGQRLESLKTEAKNT